MRVPVAVVIAPVMAPSASAPVIGSWLSRWTCSRRRLAEKPISRSAGRLVSRLPIEKSVVSLMVVLLDAGVFVVHVQAGGYALGDHPGAKQPGCAAWAAAYQLAVEDQGDLVGAADVEVVADDLFEKHPPRHRFVQHLG